MLATWIYLFRDSNWAAELDYTIDLHLGGHEYEIMPVLANVLCNANCHGRRFTGYQSTIRKNTGQVFQAQVGLVESLPLKSTSPLVALR